METISASSIGEILFNLKHTRKYIPKSINIDNNGNLLLNSDEQEIISENQKFLVTVMKIIEVSNKYDITISKLLEILKNENNFIDTYESSFHIQILDEFLKQTIDEKHS